MENNINYYERFDACYATVSSCSTNHGTHLTLDNGEEAYSSYFNAITPGSKVICTVIRPKNERYGALVTVDSVLEYAA